MSIDWFTFTAQIINFLILIWLLKRFLYGPVIEAMNAREALIAEEFSKAEVLQANAAHQKTQLAREREDLANARTDLMDQTRQEINGWRDGQLAEARDEVCRQRREWTNSLNRDKLALIRDLQVMGFAQSMRIGRKVLHELAGQDLEQLVIRRFLDKLGESQSNDRKLTPESVTIESAFSLHADGQGLLSEALAERLGPDCDFQFKVNPDLVCGIELKLPNERIGWSVRETLTELERRFVDLVDRAIPQLPDEESTFVSATAGGETR